MRKFSSRQLHFTNSEVFTAVQLKIRPATWHLVTGWVVSHVSKGHWSFGTHGPMKIKAFGSFLIDGGNLPSDVTAYSINSCGCLENVGNESAIFAQLQFHAACNQLLDSSFVSMQVA
jgi:hypothetical protein